MSRASLEPHAAAIIKAYVEDGQTTRAIAAIHGAGKTSVRELLVRHGVSLRRKGHPKGSRWGGRPWSEVCRFRRWKYQTASAAHV